jgi:hypothetical protein
MLIMLLLHTVRAVLPLIITATAYETACEVQPCSLLALLTRDCRLGISSAGKKTQQCSHLLRCYSLLY